MDIALQRIETPFAPVEAFARLRSHTPERGAYLIESRDPAHPAGRYSLVGYRVRGGESMLPHVDAFKVMAAAEAAEAPESFAAAMALGSVGAFSSCVGTLHHRVPLFDDEGPSGLFDAGATVMLFDHREGSVTVAGPAKGNLVPRLIWELEHAPAVDPIAVEEGEPSGLSAAPTDDKLTARVRGAQGFLDDDELPSLVLAQSYLAPLGGDPFVAYRALRQLAPGPLGYFVDFGKTPLAPSTQIFGFAEVALHVRSREGNGEGESASLESALGRSLPHPATYGPEPITAARLVRRLEEQSRQLWGGAVGYVCPGGEAAFLLADRLVTVIEGQAIVTVGASVDAATDPASVPRAARAKAAPLLAALRSAAH
jgi:anthranilate/para-aminobenzoate synthase component I